MAYIVDHDPKTKKEFKELAAKKQLRVLNTYTQNVETGAKSHAIEGPRAYHKWYAQVKTDDNGIIVSVK